MLQDSNSKIPPPFNPSLQQNIPESIKHNVDLKRIYGHESLKTIIKFLKFFGIVSIIISIIAALLIIPLILQVLNDSKSDITLLFFPILIFTFVIFGLIALFLFAESDFIKIKLEQLEVSYEILDSLRNGNKF
jgi:hypothetical protein